MSETDEVQPAWDKSERQALLIACVVCGAAPGESCHYPGDHEEPGIHHGRFVAAGLG